MAWDTIGKVLGTAVGGPLGGAFGGLLGGLLSNNEQSDAANQATAAQQQATLNQLATLRGTLGDAMGLQGNQFAQNLGLQQGGFDRNLGLQRQFLSEALSRAGQQGQGQMATLRGLFNPYTQAGAGALGGMNQYAQGGLQAFNQQLGLSGALGAGAQEQALAGLQNNPLLRAMSQAGEEGILGNASAIGNLRSGTTAGLLAQNRSNTLNQFVQQQLGNLGGIAGLGSQNLGALSQLGQGSAATQAGLGSDAYRTNLGLIQSLYGNAAGNVAQLGGQALGNIGNASNQFANNAGQLASNLGGDIATLQGRQGGFAAQNAMQQGRLSGGNMSMFGDVLGKALQQGGQYMAGIGPYAQPNQFIGGVTAGKLAGGWW